MSPLIKRAHTKGGAAQSAAMRHVPVQEHVEALDSKLEESECKAQLYGKHILLADDVSINRAVVKQQLEQFGAIVECAENGKIAFEMFCESEVGYYDVFLSDIEMPVMNGHEASIAIRELGREDSDLPIVALTGGSMKTDVESCFAAGMTACISKPVDPCDLANVLHEVIA